MTIEKPKLLSIEDAADYLGLPVSTMYWLRHTHRIGSYKFGRQIKFSIEDLDGYIKENYDPKIND